MNRDILQPVHFNTLEAHLFELLAIDSYFSPNLKLKELFPELYTPIDPIRIKEQLVEIFITLKRLNVLSHALSNRKRYEGFLDLFIQEQMLLLCSVVGKRDIDNRKAYDGIRTLLNNIDKHLIEDYYKKMNSFEQKCIVFIKIIADGLAHYILESQRDPFTYGDIY